MRAPRTAAELVAAGVVFDFCGGRVSCAGPKGRGDLYDALCAQIERRVVAMRPRIAASRPPAPRIVLAAAPPSPLGACGCCGDPMPAHRGGDCALCLLALARALREEGRLL